MCFLLIVLLVCDILFFFIKMSLGDLCVYFSYLWCVCTCVYSYVGFILRICSPAALRSCCLCVCMHRSLFLSLSLYIYIYISKVGDRSRRRKWGATPLP